MWTGRQADDGLVNCHPAFSQMLTNTRMTRGVFETAPFTPLQLLIDLKTDGPS